MSVKSGLNGRGFRQLRNTVLKLRDSVFSNHVFWRLLAKYLNFGDLKLCRLVSKNFNRKVLEDTNFTSRGVIKLNKDRMHPNIFGSTVEKWKNVQIRAFALSPQSQPTIDLTWLYPHLSDVKELYVSADKNFANFPIFYPPLHKVLEAANCLKKLFIEPEFLSQSDVSMHLPMPSSKTVNNTLANLTELELTSSRGRTFFSVVPGKFGEWMDCLAPAFKNVRVLQTYGVMPDYSYALENVNENAHRKVQSLLRIIESNYSHLTSLSLDDIQLWYTPCDGSLLSLSKKVFPRLNAVKIRISQIESGNMIRFLRKQPLLREIDMTVFQKFPAELFNVITERQELTRLCIKTKMFENLSSILWKRLRELKNLEVFDLQIVRTNQVVPYSQSDLFPSCIVHLPPSVNKIRLKGIQSYNTWDSNDTLVTPETFSNLNPTLLTELCISKCGACMNDDLLEFIFRNCRFLQVLNISSTDHNCTDYGFTGRPLKPNIIPFSISNLRGLRHLTLRPCGVITDETLIHGIKFPELTYLDISNNIRVGTDVHFATLLLQVTIKGEMQSLITQKGWRAVLAQNPSLEVFKTSSHCFEWEPFDKESEDKLKDQYPRLKEHKILAAGDHYSEDEDASEDENYDSEGSVFYDYFSESSSSDDEYDGENNYEDEDFDVVSD